MLGNKTKWLGGALVIALCVVSALFLNLDRSSANTSSSLSIETITHQITYTIKNWLKGGSEADDELGVAKKDDNKATDTSVASDEASPILIAPEFSHNDIKNLSATTQKILQQFEQDNLKLDAINKQLLNSKATLDELQTDFAEIAVNQQVEWAKQQAMIAAEGDKSEIPSEEDARALVTQRSQSSPINQQANALPQEVLTKVQQTTGISSEEINQLMNQQ